MCADFAYPPRSPEPGHPLKPPAEAPTPGRAAGQGGDEEAVRQSLQNSSQAKVEWEQTMDCIRDLIFVVDAAGRIRRCNRAVRDVFALEFKEIIGRDLVELCEANGLSLPSDFAVHEVQKRPDGAWYSFKQHHLGSRGESRPEAGFNKVVTFHDITLVMAMRAQLATEHARLQERNGQLETALAELKNAQARLLQQENMVAIGRLAAGVAHEINTPLGFISANLGALAKYLGRFNDFIRLQEEAIGDGEGAAQVTAARQKLKINFAMQDGRELISESLDGVARVSKIVGSLKAFSRLEDGPELQRADLNECLEATISILPPELLGQVVVRKEYGDVPRIRCLPQQLNQVFMHLLINAAQAVDRQGEITVRTRTETAAVSVAISDTGCGIPAAQLPRIFEPFFTTRPLGQGTGLGLSVCYEIVRQHAGEITVESPEGGGATFTVRLPLRDQ